jgi:uncharacterized protein YjdB
MKRIFTVILFNLLLTSCIVDPDLIINLGKKLPTSNSSDSSLLIGGKTLRQQISLKVEKLELEEFQEVDFTNYIDLKNSILKIDDLIWKSKNKDIAIIDSSTGKLRALKEGNTVIVVSLKNNQDIFATIDLKVKKKKVVSKIQIIPSEFTLNVGQSRELIAEVYLIDGQVNSNVSWSSSDNTIAVVSKTGKVTALKKGKVTIVATYNLDISYKAVSLLEVIDN